eukprot:11198812-Lingulodinium_polyedra.AAC.1
MFEERDAKGLKRVEVRAWLENMSAKLEEVDASLRKALGEIECRGIKSTSFKIYLKEPRMGTEVMGVMRELIDNEEN